MALGGQLLLRADFQSSENALCHGRVVEGRFPLRCHPSPEPWCCVACCFRDLHWS